MSVECVRRERMRQERALARERAEVGEGHDERSESETKRAGGGEIINLYN